MRAAAVLVGVLAAFLCALIAYEAIFDSSNASKFWASFPQNVIIIDLAILGIIALCAALYWQEREVTDKRVALGAFRLWLTIAVAAGSPPILLCILGILEAVHVKFMGIDIDVKTRDTGYASALTMLIAGLFALYFWTQFQKYTRKGRLRG